MKTPAKNNKKFNLLTLMASPMYNDLLSLNEETQKTNFYKNNATPSIQCKNMGPQS